MEKLREAKERQIRFLSDFHYPQNTKLNAFDLSVIMNNALNNCMENVSGDDPYISISSFENSIFMITIKTVLGVSLILVIAICQKQPNLGGNMEWV